MEAVVLGQYRTVRDSEPAGDCLADCTCAFQCPRDEKSCRYAVFHLTFGTSGKCYRERRSWPAHARGRAAKGWT